METREPELKSVIKTAAKHLGAGVEVARVTRGVSTYVYRAVRGNEIFYLRFAKDGLSFAVEALVHEKIRVMGVKAPRVFTFEDREEFTGCPFMLVGEIAGACLADEGRESDARDILREAGRQLARIHSVPVDGFGWIDRTERARLRGQKPDFATYFGEFLQHDLAALDRYPFDAGEKKRYAAAMREAESLLPVRDAVLVHGDFDKTHIFHVGVAYTGIIDFGEIRGNNRLYDLATFVGFCQDRAAYELLLEGYGEAHRLTRDDLRGVELLALFVLLRFLGKKVDMPAREHWFGLARAQLRHVE